MSIIFACTCGKRFKTADTHIGRKVRCSGCGAVLTVPSVDESVIQASNDSHRLKADAGYDVAGSPEQQGSQPSGVQCPGCETLLPPGTVICECGYSLRLGKYVRESYAQGKGPKPWFNLLGIEFTPAKAIPFFIMVGLLVSLVTWVFVGPLNKMKVGKITPVHMAELVDSMGVIQPGSLFQGTFFTQQRGGVTMPGGVAPPPNSPVAVAQGEVYELGGTGECLAIRKADAGDFLMVQVEMGEQFLRARKVFAGMGMDLFAEANRFEIEVGGQRIKPMVLFKQMPDQPSLIINRAGNLSDVWPTVVQPNVQHSSRQGPGDESVRAMASYDGLPNASGQLEFSMFVTEMGQVVSSTRGQVQVKLPEGFDLNYQYQGGELNITADADTQFWRSDVQQTLEASVLGYAHYPMMLLFPRPDKNAGAMTIYFDGVKVGSVSSKYGGTPPPAPTSSRGGKVDPYDYLGAMSKARTMAKNTVAASNMKQLLLAMQTYQQTHGGQFPDSLDTLVLSMPEMDIVMTHPRSGEKPGFVYVNPQTMPSGRIPVLYEALNGQIDPHGSIGYSDGTIDVK